MGQIEDDGGLVLEFFPANLKKNLFVHVSEGQKLVPSAASMIREKGGESSFWEQSVFVL